MEREELKIKHKGREIDWDVNLIICPDILSGPGEVSLGIEEISLVISSCVLRRHGGYGNGGGERGCSGRNEQDWLKELEKKRLRSSGLDFEDEAEEPYKQGKGFYFYFC